MCVAVTCRALLMEVVWWLGDVMGCGVWFVVCDDAATQVPDHLLQQAFELVPAQGRYRRFSDTFSQCTFVTTLWPG